jgi:hypothetical protein
MRTTITFKQDVAAAIERLRRERSIGVSEAVNDLIRIGLRTKSRRPTYTARAQPIGLRIDVTNVAEALEQLEEPNAR